MNKLDNTQIELRHIQLELENGRAQDLRTFMDRYYCYKNGYIYKKSGNANWHVLFWKEVVSVEANKTRDKGLVTKEHTVPVVIITQKLKELPKPVSLSAIQAILDKYIVFTTITKQEDKLLNKSKLRDKMPDEFYDVTNPLYNDLFARYKKVGIEYEIL